MNEIKENITKDAQVQSLKINIKEEALNHYTTIPNLKFVQYVIKIGNISIPIEIPITISTSSHTNKNSLESSDIQN